MRALRGLQTHGRRWALASAAFGLHQVVPAARGAHLEAAARVAASPPRAFRDDLWCKQRAARNRGRPAPVSTAAHPAGPAVQHMLAAGALCTRRTGRPGRAPRVRGAVTCPPLRSLARQRTRGARPSGRTSAAPASRRGALALADTPATARARPARA